MTSKQLRELDSEMANKVMSILPALELAGWCGTPNGWKSYLPNWDKEGNLPAGLMLLAGAKSGKERESIRKKIIDRFYGGEKGYWEYKRALVESVPSVFEKCEIKTTKMSKRYLKKFTNIQTPRLLSGWNKMTPADWDKFDQDIGR